MEVVFIFLFDGISIVIGIMEMCGKWYVVKEEDICVGFCFVREINIILFLIVNLLLGIEYFDCSVKLSKGKVYCVGLIYDWNL